MIEQTSIFDFINHTSNSYKINKPIRLIELFAGIGSQAKALKNIGANFEHFKVVEFDKYAVASYNAIHGTNFTTSDITQIKGTDLEISETDKYCYVMTYSFPCQDLSLAGKQAGMTKGSETRSGLLWEVERLLNETKELPQVLLMENVPQVHSKKNILDFDKWIEFLQSKGYCNYWQDLNAKDFGIPQNRNRTFMVSILGSYEYEFPKPFELKLRLKDMLEKEVNEKYFLSGDLILNSLYLEIMELKAAIDEIDEKGDFNEDTVEKHNRAVIRIEELEEVHSKLILAGNLTGGKWDKIHESCRRVYDELGIAPTIHTCQGGNTEPKIIVKSLWSETQAKMITPEGNVKRYLNSDVVDEFKEGQVADISFPNGYNKGNRVFDVCPVVNGTTTGSSFIVKVKDKRGNEFPLYKDTKQLRETIEKNEFEKGEPLNLDLYNRATYKESQTLCSPTHNSQRLYDGLRIRKFTPKECFRLMGFDDEGYEKAAKVNSNSQLYKQAGNSIVVNVLEEIFKKLLNIEEN